MVRKNLLVLLSVFAAVGCGGEDLEIGAMEAATTLTSCDYPQAFGNSAHTGNACLEQRGMRVVQVLVQDPDADKENAAAGFLQIHESPPLTSGDFVVVPGKRGFVSRFNRKPEKWSMQVHKWEPSVTAPGARLLPVWSTDTTWQPVDSIVGSRFSYTNGYVQQFAPAIANGSVYVPSRFGRLVRYSLTSGAVEATINPFAGTPFDGDDRTIVTNAVSVDRFGSVYYTVVAFPNTDRIDADPRGSWLVKVTPSNVIQKADFAALAVAAGAPAETDGCEYAFGTAGTGAPTSPDSKPPVFQCGFQRPAMNAPVAIDDANRLVMYSYANNATTAAFLITADARTLAPLQAFDTRGHLLHGCGVRLPLSGPSRSCAAITANGTTHIGFDPSFNRPVPFHGGDLMDNAPVIAPNGDVTIGGYDGGFGFGGGYDSRGAGLTFNRGGEVVAKNEDFFWEVTPSVMKHDDGSFSYLADRNLYSNFDLTVAQYTNQWRAESLGTIDLDFNADTIDWLDSHILFDTTGRHYAVNGTGVAVAFDANGNAVDQVELTNADGTIRSMETLSGYGARDRAGRLYLSYAGNVYVIEGTGVDNPPSSAPAASQALRRGVAAKRAAGPMSVLPRAVDATPGVPEVVSAVTNPVNQCTYPFAAHPGQPAKPDDYGGFVGSLSPEDQAVANVVALFSSPKGTTQDVVCDQYRCGYCCQIGGGRMCCCDKSTPGRCGCDI